ncbi:MAG: PKD domain-containing protein, partial [Verrucomicrobiota bacterium]
NILVDWYVTTPAAMVQMAMNNTRIVDPLWRSTEDFIADEWPIENAASKIYYAFYSFTKAMRLAKPRPVSIMQKSGLDWFNDPVHGLRQKIVNEQESNGSWIAYGTDNNGFPLREDFSTSWAIAMLRPGLFIPTPVASIDAPLIWRFDDPLHLNAAQSFHIDEKRDIEFYRWDLNNDGLFELTAIDPNDTNAVLMVPDPNPGATGDAPIDVTVRLLVTDDGYPTQSDEILLTIRFQESPVAPYADTGGPYSGENGFPVTFDAGGSQDLDPGDSITEYRWDFDHDCIAEIITTNPVIQHTFPDVGLYVVGLQVVDGGVGSATNLFSDWDFTTVIVLNRNSPPAFTPGPDIVADPGVTPRSYPAWATDISPGSGDEEFQTVFFVSTNDNLMMFDAQPLISPEGRLTFTPSFYADGVATVTVYLSDNGGTNNNGSNRSAEVMFTITIDGDQDDDGLLDTWEILHFGDTNLTDGTTDFDGDGFIEAHEFRADTIPTNGLSRLVINAIRPSGPHFEIEWQSVATRRYNLLKSTNLYTDIPFRIVATNIPGLPVFTTGVDSNSVNELRVYYVIELDE